MACHISKTLLQKRILFIKVSLFINELSKKNCSNLMWGIIVQFNLSFHIGTNYITMDIHMSDAIILSVWLATCKSILITTWYKEQSLWLSHILLKAVRWPQHVLDIMTKWQPASPRQKNLINLKAASNDFNSACTRM